MLCLSGLELYSRWVPLSGEPVFIENNNKTFKGRKCGNYKTLGRLNYYNLAIQLRMRNRIFTRPFVVDLLSEGKPIKNTVLSNRTCT